MGTPARRVAELALALLVGVVIGGRACVDEPLPPALVQRTVPAQGCDCGRDAIVSDRPAPNPVEAPLPNRALPLDPPDSTSASRGPSIETPDAFLVVSDLPRCLVPFESEPKSAPLPSAASNSSIEVKLRNTCGDLPVLVRWMKVDGGIGPQLQLAPHVEAHYSRYAGERFRLFDDITGRWIRDMELTSSGAIDLCACE